MLGSDIFKRIPIARRKGSGNLEWGATGTNYRLQFWGLFQHQHRLLVDAMRLNWVALCLTLLTVLVLLSFKGEFPSWLSYVPMVLSLLLFLALIRFGLQFRSYVKNWNDMEYSLLAERSDNSTTKVDGKEARVFKKEPAFRSQGRLDRWDHRPCTSCGRRLGLSVATCPHCGSQQKTLLHN